MHLDFGVLKGWCAGMSHLANEEACLAPTSFL